MVTAVDKCHPRETEGRKNPMVCPHPPDSPALVLGDFRLFPKIKITMKEKFFGSTQDTEAAITAVSLQKTSRAAAASGEDSRS